jgi:hypothetical protein
MCLHDAPDDRHDAGCKAALRMEPMIGESQVLAKEEVSIRHITQVNGAGQERSRRAALSSSILRSCFETEHGWRG